MLVAPDLSGEMKINQDSEPRRGDIMKPRVLTRGINERNVLIAL
jgi:hypothetical protein